MRVLEKKDKSKVGRLTSSVACTKYGEVPGPETTVGGRGKGSGCGWQGKGSGFLEATEAKRRRVQVSLSRWRGTWGAVSCWETPESLEPHPQATAGNILLVFTNLSCVWHLLQDMV